ncbi:complement C2 isoform X2 [Scleropages formosus]|uniref:complement C2 isoform X2 n=1 Tax=Scleropages formosus TaxID=113540 RepID=UPI000878B950|nr:complement C2-like isoform X2 [Scleropages formosus]
MKCEALVVAAMLCVALLDPLGRPAARVQAQENAYEGSDYYEQQQNCSAEETIARGSVSYSLGGAPGSVLTYHCGTGYYPFPVSQRVCDTDGEWATMRLASGRRVTQATCKEVLCPAQIQLDNGEFWPRQQWFQPGETQHFSCHDGFTLYGSALRNCTVSGVWTGTTPACDDQVFEARFCLCLIQWMTAQTQEPLREPCVPEAVSELVKRSSTAVRQAWTSWVRQRGFVWTHGYGVGPRLAAWVRVPMCRFLPQSQLSASVHRERSSSTSGKQTNLGSKQFPLTIFSAAQFTFDSPEMVSQAMAGSLSSIFEVSSSSLKRKVSFGRTIQVADGRLNIYILLDTSGSINKENFDSAKSATISLIQKLDSYEVDMKFHVISYATDVKVILSIRDNFFSPADQAVAELQKFQYKVAQEIGLSTNMYKALHNVYENMAFLKENSRNRFNETQHVILIITDGYVNMGLDPMKAVVKIRSLLGFRVDSLDHTSENLLDIYVFGVGDSVNKKQLNAIASKKMKEEHVFILKKYKDLGKVFDSMISDSGVTTCGVAKELAKSQVEDYTRPWHVDVLMSSKKLENCKGSILTPDWILTAAHCFTKSIVNNPEKVEIQHGNGKVKASSVILHPQYDLRRLTNKNVREFYDYDIALVKVNESIKLSERARPICLPCTKSSNRALKMSPNATCEEHEKALLALEETPAYFLTPKNAGHQRKLTHIHLKSKRPDCIKHAAITLSPNSTASVQDVVTDRFMCTGGSTQYKDSLTCKGDSGGALFLQERKRYFQVGVVSWGTKDMCKYTDHTYSRDSPPEDARDFHLSVFSVLPWLQNHLGQALEFLAPNN